MAVIYPISGSYLQIMTSFINQNVIYKPRRWFINQNVIYKPRSWFNKSGFLSKRMPDL